MGGGRSKFGVTYGSKRYKELKAGGRTNRGRFEDFGEHYEALQKSTAWFADENNSNSTDWLTNLTQGEKTALKDYTGESGIDYKKINKALYTQNWEDISPAVRARIEDMDRAFEKSVILKGMQVTRQCDFKIFGSSKSMSIEQIKDYIKKNGDNGVLENKGYLSFGANNHGAAIAGWGLVIHAKVPPSRGAGAYINPISKMSGSSENEFLFNRNSNFKFDLKSLRKDSSGKIHINATWVPGKKKKKK